MLERRQFVEDHRAHLGQVGEIEGHVRQLSHISEALAIESSGSIPHLVQRIQVRHYLSSTSELNAAICDSLRTGRYSVAEALARVSIEMSANLIFVLGGTKHARSKGLLKHHLHHSRQRLKKWSDFAKKSGLIAEQLAADARLGNLNELELHMQGLNTAPIEPWPRTSLDKFVAIGQEGRFRTLFASSSDSVHLLGEDIVNLMICEAIPESHRAETFALVAAEKASFAVYLLIASAMFQAEAIEKARLKVSSNDDEDEILNGVYASLCRLYEQHEADAKKYYSPRS